MKDVERFKIRMYKGEDGYIIAEAIELPGCVSQGKTREAALKNIKESIAGYIKTLKAHHQTFRRVELGEVRI